MSPSIHSSNSIRGAHWAVFACLLAATGCLASRGQNGDASEGGGAGYSSSERRTGTDSGSGSAIGIGTGFEGGGGSGVPAPSMADCGPICSALVSCGADSLEDCDDNCAGALEQATQGCELEWSAWSTCVARNPACSEDIFPCPGEAQLVEDCIVSNGSRDRSDAPRPVGASGYEDMSAGDDQASSPDSSTPRRTSVEHPEVPSCDLVDRRPSCAGALGSSSGGSVDGGAGSCETTCSTADQHLGSYCSGGLCACSIDGFTYCQCRRPGAYDECATCCPGLADPVDL